MSIVADGQMCVRVCLASSSVSRLPLWTRYEASSFSVCSDCNWPATSSTQTAQAAGVGNLHIRSCSKQGESCATWHSFTSSKYSSVSVRSDSHWLLTSGHDTWQPNIISHVSCGQSWRNTHSFASPQLDSSSSFIPCSGLQSSLYTSLLPLSTFSLHSCVNVCASCQMSTSPQCHSPSSPTFGSLTWQSPSCRLPLTFQSSTFTFGATGCVWSATSPPGSSLQNRMDRYQLTPDVSIGRRSTGISEYTTNILSPILSAVQWNFCRQRTTKLSQRKDSSSFALDIVTWPDKFCDLAAICLGKEVTWLLRVQHVH